ncbi:MAG: hypothetical protein MJ141_04930, partial [Clostridia bacterium]|nr:hypothetical protein [Clostridia bacterium]
MRKDGIRVKCDDPIYAVVPYIMPHRYDAMNMITLDIPTENMNRYRAEKRRQGTVLRHLGQVLAPCPRTLYESPHLSRYIVN